MNILLAIGGVAVCFVIMLLGMIVFTDRGTSPCSSVWAQRWYFVATFLWGGAWMGIAAYLCILAEVLK